MYGRMAQAVDGRKASRHPYPHSTPPGLWWYELLCSAMHCLPWWTEPSEVMKKGWTEPSEVMKELSFPYQDTRLTPSTEDYGISQEPTQPGGAMPIGSHYPWAKKDCKNFKKNPEQDREHTVPSHGVVEKGFPVCALQTGSIHTSFFLVVEHKYSLLPQIMQPTFLHLEKSWVSIPGVQWMSLTLGKSPSWSWDLPCQEDHQHGVKLTMVLGVRLPGLNMTLCFQRIHSP